jgi:hypothetical protein
MQLLTILTVTCVPVANTVAQAPTGCVPRGDAMQVELRPRPGDARFTVPSEWFEAAWRWTVGETNGWRCQVLARLAPPAAGWLPELGVSNQWYMGATPLGAFSASADLHATSDGGRAWLCLYWYPSAEMFVSLQVDAVQLRPRLHVEYIRCCPQP